MTRTNHLSLLALALESLRIDLLIAVRSAEQDAYLLDRARTLLGRGDHTGAYCALSTGPGARQEMRTEWGAELADRWVALEAALEALGEPTAAVVRVCLCGVGLCRPGFGICHECLAQVTEANEQRDARRARKAVRQ